MHQPDCAPPPSGGALLYVCGLLACLFPYDSFYLNVFFLGLLRMRCRFLSSFVQIAPVVLSETACRAGRRRRGASPLLVWQEVPCALS